MDKLTGRVYDFIRNRKLLKPGDSVVVGVSGGADSVCLLSILTELRRLMKLKLIAVHVNHGLRGEAALSDQLYTQELCGRLEVECRVFSEDIARLARETSTTEEEAGRNYRYSCFRQAARQNGAGKIAVAHHLDDQSETVLMNLFRGSGPDGLTGMRAGKGDIIRPLLCVRRSEIEEYLQRKGLGYCTDRTNFETEHMRNRLRLQVLPLVRERVNPEADSHIAGMSDILFDIMEHIHREGDEAFSSCCRNSDDRSNDKSDNMGYDKNACMLHVDLRQFENFDVCIQREVLRKAFQSCAGGLKDIGAVHVENLRKLAFGREGKIISLPYGLTGKRTGTELLIYRKSESGVEGAAAEEGATAEEAAAEEAAAEEEATAEEGAAAEKGFAVEKGSGTELLIFGKSKIGPLGSMGEDSPIAKPADIFMESDGIAKKLMKFEVLDFTPDEMSEIPRKMYTKWFDYDKISGGLALRHRRAGDFMELASGSRKALRRIMIDDRIPSDERDDMLLLADGDHILWMVGSGRISEYYKVSAGTRHVLAVQLLQCTGETAGNYVSGKSIEIF